MLTMLTILSKHNRFYSFCGFVPLLYLYAIKAWHIHRATTSTFHTVITPCPGKNAPPPKQNAVKCTVYNTIQ